MAYSDERAFLCPDVLRGGGIGMPGSFSWCDSRPMLLALGPFEPAISSGRSSRYGDEGPNRKRG